MTNQLLQELKNSSIRLQKNDPLIEYMKLVEKIIVFDNYGLKPYLNTTQNEEYMRRLLTPEMHTAFTITGGTDSIFQLILNGTLNITAVDINELARFIYALKKASIKTLTMSEYESFILDRKGISFLSKDVFAYVQSGFSETEQLEKSFWEKVFYSVPREEFIQYMFKGGMDAVSMDKAREYLLFVKKNRYYQRLKQNLENANVKIVTDDAFSYLEHVEETYDYIDLTNILLFIYQSHNRDEFDSYIDKLPSLLDKKLNEKGIFVIDYLFGYIASEINHQGSLEQMKIYRDILAKLSQKFSLDFMEVNATPGATPLQGTKDTVVYIKK